MKIEKNGISVPPNSSLLQVQELIWWALSTADAGGHQILLPRCAGILSRKLLVRLLSENIVIRPIVYEELTKESGEMFSRVLDIEARYSQFYLPNDGGIFLQDLNELKIIGSDQLVIIHSNVKYLRPEIFDNSSISKLPRFRNEAWEEFKVFVELFDDQIDTINDRDNCLCLNSELHNLEVKNEYSISRSRLCGGYCG